MCFVPPHKGSFVTELFRTIFQKLSFNFHFPDLIIMQPQTQKYVLRHSLRYLSLHKQLCPYHEKRKENGNKIEKKVEYLIPTCIEGFMKGVTLIKTRKVVSSFGANKGRVLHLFSVKIKRYFSRCLSIHFLVKNCLYSLSLIISLTSASDYVHQLSRTGLTPF